MSRILVDISALWDRAGLTSQEVWDVHRTTAIACLSSNLPSVLLVVFEGEALHVVDPVHALDWLSSTLTWAPEAPSESPAGSEAQPRLDGGVAGAVRHIASRARSLAGALLGLAPEAARGELREGLHHIAAGVRLWLRPPTNRQPAVAASDLKPSLSLIAHPTSGDVVWTCGPSSRHAALRWMAEVKLACGFRVTSVCLAVDGVASIDQLDAADLIVCGSYSIREELHQLAVDSGRPIPNARVAQLNWAAGPFDEIVELLHDMCEEVVETRAMAV